MQTKKDSLKESLINVAIGLTINMVANAFIIPVVLGVKVPLTGNIALGVFFTVISITRSYCIRRWHERKSYMSKSEIEYRCC